MQMIVKFPLSSYFTLFLKNRRSRPSEGYEKKRVLLTSLLRGSFNCALFVNTLSIEMSKDRRWTRAPLELFLF